MGWIAELLLAFGANAIGFQNVTVNGEAMPFSQPAFDRANGAIFELDHRITTVTDEMVMASLVHEHVPGRAAGVDRPGQPQLTEQLKSSVYGHPTDRIITGPNRLQKFVGAEMSSGSNKSPYHQLS